MSNGLWASLSSLWNALRDVITFKMSFIISLFLFYFVVRTVKELKLYGMGLKNKDKV